MAVFLISNSTSVSDILIPDIGFFVPAGGGDVEFTTIREFEVLSNSEDLITLTSDDFGDGNPSLKINDGTNDIDPSAVEQFLNGLFQDLPEVSARDSVNSNLIYVGRLGVPGAATSSPNWQIYRIDISQVNPPKLYPNGQANFNQAWDNRESLTYTAI